jgi:hypothetical protein
VTATRAGRADLSTSGSTETPLNGDDVIEITLSLANDFSYTKEVPVEGGGTFMVDIVLMNPYTSLPSED